MSIIGRQICCGKLGMSLCDDCPKVAPSFRERLRIPLEHVDSIECWCSPEVAHVDPETGVNVIVHRARQ